MIIDIRVFFFEHKEMCYFKKFTGFRNGIFAGCTGDMADGKSLMMLFTNLYDSNGEQLFVGDVIRSSSSRNEVNIHLIHFYDGRFVAVHTLHDEDTDHMCGVDQSWINNHGKELIGNIYERPSLNVWKESLGVGV